MTCIIERSELFKEAITIDGFSEENECHNCHGEYIGDFTLTVTEESYDLHKRFHGQLVRINVIKETK